MSGWVGGLVLEGDLECFVQGFGTWAEGLRYFGGTGRTRSEGVFGGVIGARFQVI